MIFFGPCEKCGNGALNGACPNCLGAENERLKLKLTALVTACKGIIWTGRGEMRDWTEDSEKIEAFDKAVIEAMAEVAEKEEG